MSQHFCRYTDLEFCISSAGRVSKTLSQGSGPVDLRSQDGNPTTGQKVGGTRRWKRRTRGPDRPSPDLSPLFLAPVPEKYTDRRTHREEADNSRKTGEPVPYDKDVPLVSTPKKLGGEGWSKERSRSK